MARTKAFDVDEVVQKAVMAFWSRGFEGTTIGDLEKATGIARTSLYNAFGDKDAIFKTVLKRYHDMAHETMETVLRGNGLDAVEMIFSGLSEPHDINAPQNFGCLMVNTVLDVRNVDGDAEELVKAYREMLLQAFEGAVSLDIKNGVVRDDLDAKQASEFLVAAMWGIMATIRLYNSPEFASGIVHQTLRTISDWKL